MQNDIEQRDQVNLMNCGFFLLLCPEMALCIRSIQGRAVQLTIAANFTSFFLRMQILRALNDALNGLGHEIHFSALMAIFDVS